MNSGSWWWTGRPGVLRFMGSWRVGHDWVTELNWTMLLRGFPMAQKVKNPPAIQETTCNAGDPVSISRSGRSFGKGNGYPLQYSCLGNLMDRGAWQAIVHGVTKVGQDLATKPQPLTMLLATKQWKQQMMMAPVFSSLEPVDLLFYMIKITCRCDYMKDPKMWERIQY